MNKSDMAKLVKRFNSSVIKHSPKILMGVGIAGMVTTTVMAVKATPRAMELIQDEEIYQNGPLTTVEKVKVAWKPYIPAAVTGAASVACLIGSCSVSTRRTAALTAAYQISETALAEYREAALQTVGEKKEKTIREQVSRDRVERNPVKQSEVIVTGKGESLFMDPHSKRCFKSDIDQINKIVNMLNKRMLHDMFGYVSLSEFYDEIGLDRTDISDDLGWNIDKGLIEVEFHPVMNNDGKPCLALYYLNPPKWGYDGTR